MIKSFQVSVNTKMQTKPGSVMNNGMIVLVSLARSNKVGWVGDSEDGTQMQ